MKAKELIERMLPTPKEFVAVAKPSLRTKWPKAYNLPRKKRS